jgi:hypothetical protein
MARVHTEADIRAVCQQLINAEGERGLTRTAVERALKALAEERGLGPSAGDHRTVSNVIAVMKAELRAARTHAQGGSSEGLEDFPLPAGLDPLLEQVRSLYRRAMSEEARRSASATEARIRRLEAQSAEDTANLRAEIEGLERDTAEQASRLDETETALVAARDALAALTAAQAESIKEFEARDRDTRTQLSMAQQAVQEAVAAGIDAEERARASELARVKAAGELEFTVERAKRLEHDLSDTRSRGAILETRARDAERERDTARGRLVALEGECEWLSRRVGLTVDGSELGEEESVPTNRPNEKAKRVGGR